MISNGQDSSIVSHWLDFKMQQQHTLKFLALYILYRTYLPQVLTKIIYGLIFILDVSKPN